MARRYGGTVFVDPYTDSETGVFVNFMGIRDLARLRRVEAGLCAAARSEPFCMPQYIESQATEVFSSLAKEQHLRGLSRDHFVDRLTHYLAEINAIHPFREGNGRAQRAFVRQLCRTAGWAITWARLNQDRNDHASMLSIRGDNMPLRALLDEFVLERGY